MKATFRDQYRLAYICGGIGLLASMAAMGSGRAQPDTARDSFAAQCSALKGSQLSAAGIISRSAPGAETYVDRGPGGSQSLQLPPHCEVHGAFPARSGRNGQRYGIKYHLRLPEKWNGRFLFQGGGGTNGELGSAIGPTGSGNPAALALGYAVVSQDSGHDNATNTDPRWGGTSVFGTDPMARRDYGHASLPKVARAAKELIRQLYGRPAEYSYFYGCSKGGQEGMAFAQRYPDMFDGIVAAAPGFSLPRAAVAQAWDTQTFARLWNPVNGKLTPTGFASLFTDADFTIIRSAVTSSCDGLDGLVDGSINAFDRCTSVRVLPLLRRSACTGDKADANQCIAPAKIDAVQRSLDGPRDAKGQPIYADWPWDTGIGTQAWSFWKLGSRQMPSLNILTGGASLPTIIMVPPRSVGESPEELLAFQLALRFPDDAAAIYATSRTFPRSAWEDIAMRSSNLDRFRKAGGKLIVPHGVSDPVFSINDTLQWHGEVNARYTGDAASFVRVFPVPGMAHCGGGDATDQFDALSALTAWVEKDQAPDQIVAAAGPSSSRSGRTRPLCPFPNIATYNGTGDTEDFRSFQCKEP